MNEDKGWTPKFEMMVPCNIEEIQNPLSVKREANDYTSLPSDCKSWNEYEDWLTYDNSEFRATKNFEECWADVDILKEKFGEVWLININYGERVREESKTKRYTFGFDYAIAAATEKQRRKIKRLADNYRNIPSKDWNCTRAIKLLVPLIAELKSYPFVEGHFS